MRAFAQRVTDGWGRYAPGHDGRRRAVYLPRAEGVVDRRFRLRPFRSAFLPIEKSERANGMRAGSNDFASNHDGGYACNMMEHLPGHSRGRTFGGDTPACRMFWSSMTIR